MRYITHFPQHRKQGGLLLQSRPWKAHTNKRRDSIEIPSRGLHMQLLIRTAALVLKVPDRVRVAREATQLSNKGAFVCPHKSLESHLARGTLEQSSDLPQGDSGGTEDVAGRASNVPLMSDSWSSLYQLGPMEKDRTIW
ncbi:hypothetical protein D3C85_1260330 [compost metagenome]